MEKICSRCFLTKPLNIFSTDKRNADGKGAHCLECQKIFSRAYYQKNKQKVCQRTGEYRKQYPELYKRASKKYTQKNPEKTVEANHRSYLKNLLDVKKRHKQWRLDNPEKVRFMTASYRAAKIKRTPGWANLKKIEEFYINCPEGFEVDHILPLRGKNVSGLHVEYNLQYLTMSENRSKNNRV